MQDGSWICLTTDILARSYHVLCSEHPRTQLGIRDDTVWARLSPYPKAADWQNVEVPPQCEQSFAIQNDAALAAIRIDCHYSLLFHMLKHFAHSKRCLIATIISCCFHSVQAISYCFHPCLRCWTIQKTLGAECAPPEVSWWSLMLLSSSCFWCEI